jgi:trimethylamine--corrinoid protein Co-methyltransferase
MAREGILIDTPYERMTEKQVMQIHQASMEILRDPGLMCFNRQAAEIFGDNGAEVSSVTTSDHSCWLVKVPEKLVVDALDNAPKTVKLGARNPDNTLVMNGEVPRVYFISGSETNIWLDVDFPTYVKKSDPSAEIQSLNNTTKHVMSGLTNLKQLDNVVNMAKLIVGGEEELKDNPIISFITCLVKSPLQFVEDTTDTFIEICRRELPVVVSSSPQAGSTAPIKEAGIMAQINAEVLAGITLGQLVNKGTPVIYGSVPVRARMDTLGDSYGSVETSQYNVDCVQMARFYKIPNYSTSGVCDAKIPGQQASIERLFSDILVTLSGPQYLHCAYGLLDCNSIFCLLQAVLDDAHFKMIKFFLRPPRINETEITEVFRQIREVVATPQKLYIRHIRPVLRSGEISMSYPFEGDGETDSVFVLAHERMKELLAKPVEHIDRATTSKIFNEIPGLLPRLNVYEEGR